MRVPQSFIEEVKMRNRIDDVISSYVNLKRAGSTHQGLCPFHSEKTPSFTVFTNTDSFYCFGCGAGGDVISFIMRVENLEYMGAVEFLAKRVGLEMPEAEGEEKSASLKRARVYAMNKDAAKFFNRMLYEPSSQAARDYLAKRQLSQAAVKRFGLGFAPDSFFALRDHMHSLGYRDEELQEAFLCGKSQKTGNYYDIFRNRIMFPIIDNFQNVIAFGGRDIGNDERKYINSSDTPVFKKSRNLFALNFARNAGAEFFILCEGYMDVVAVNMAGFPNAVATLGTSLTTEQARVIAKYTKKVILSYDSDRPGVAAAKRAIPMLTEVGLDVKLLHMEGAKDPDEYIKKFGVDRFKLLLDKSDSRIDYLCNDVLSRYNILIPEQKTKAAAEICAVLADIPSDVEREVYIGRVAERLSVSQASLAKDVERQMKKDKRRERAELTRKVVSDTLGYGDRVNRDYVGNVKAARAEEGILGLLLLHPELADEVKRGKVRLSPEDFVTEFNKRVLASILQCEGACSISTLVPDYATEEIDRITAMLTKRGELTRNDSSVLTELIASLHASTEEKTSSAEIDDIQKLINKKKK